MPPEGRLVVASFSGRRGVQALVAEELEDRALVFVGARLGHDLDGASPGPAVLGLDTGGDDLELLDGIHRDLLEEPAHGVVGVVPAVEGIEDASPGGVRADADRGNPALGGIKRSAGRAPGTRAQLLGAG
jgi:hypothetical protein